MIGSPKLVPVVRRPLGQGVSQSSEDDLTMRMEELAMETQGIVVLPGQGSVWNMSPGRSAALKLLGGATGGSVMLFEETVPAGTMSTFHLHHDSDEVAYVLSGEVTFKIGEVVTVGG